MATKKQQSKKPVDPRFKITISRNGPYVVYGGIPVEENIIIRDGEGISHEWRIGKRYQIQDKYELCRCGHSKNKPYCDGTHSCIQFDGTETAGNDPYIKYAKVHPISNPIMPPMICPFSQVSYFIAYE